MSIENNSGQQVSAALAITKVQDSSSSLPNPGTTSDIELTLSGTGTENAVVVIKDEGNMLGTASVIGDGSWVKSVEAAVGRHVYTVNEGAAVSASWVITVVAQVVPQINSVKDSQGVEIPEEGTTVDTRVTLSGSAQASQTVELLDQGKSIGAADVDANGAWARVFQDMARERHSIKAKALYGSNPESAERHFTIEAKQAPPAPDVLEDSSANVLDLKDLARITVRVPNYGMQLNDTVRVRWLGINQHDTAIKTIVTLAPLDVDIPLSWAREDLDKTVILTYSYGRNGQSIVVSLPLTISVVQTSENLNLIPPLVLEAFGPGGDQLEFSRLPNGTDVHVRVPQYPGMAIGQTVRVRWVSRVVFDTDIKPVERIMPIEFTIWRDEVIDSIGQLVVVNYSVVEQQDGPINPSKALDLTVLPQSLNLVAPTINAGTTTVSVAYQGSLTSHTISVRWRGVNDHTTGVQRPPANGGITRFTIPAQWVTENRGRQVLINYSVGAGDNPMIFSQLLRINV